MPRLADNLLCSDVLLTSWIDAADPQDAERATSQRATLRKQLPTAPVIVSDKMTQQRIEG